MAKLSNVAVKPSPGMGHLIPLVEFARRLVATHPSFRVTLIVPTIGQPTKPVKSTLESLPITVQHVYLPPVTFPDPPPHPGVQLSVAMSRSVAPRGFEIVVRGNMLSAILFDSELIESVKDFNVPAYVFFTGNAMVLSLCLYLPELDRVVSGEYRDFPDPIEIPGGFPVHGRDLPDPLQDRKSSHYESILRLSKLIVSADGIMVNSFTELEKGAVKALREGEGVPPVYPIGPLLNDGSGGSECLEWLNK